MYKGIKGILFDKDGTLLDIDTLWVPIGEALIREITRRHRFPASEKERLRGLLGIENGTLRPNSVLASGTAREIAAALSGFLVKTGAELSCVKTEAEVRGLIMKTINSNKNLIVPRGDLADTFTVLKSADIKIGLATSDMYDSAVACLRQLGVDKFFDYIGADTGNVGNKPSPDMLNSFCDTCGLSPCEVAVVGDSQVDIDMARNGGAGMAIAIVNYGSVWPDKPPMNADCALSSIDELLKFQELFAGTSIS
jgi:phosphoglycolate phosphatase